MAVRKVQGFEDSTAADAAGIKSGTGFSYDTTTTNKTISGFGSGQSLKVTQVAYYQLTSAASGAGDKLHVALYHATGTVGDSYIQLLDSAGSVQAAIDFRSRTDGLTRIRRGAALTGTLLATSTATIPLDAWTTFKIIATCREAASSGRIQVFINGSSTAHVDTGASVDCRSSGIDDFRIVRLGNGTGNTTGTYYDCFYWTDSSETVPDEPLYISALRPNGDGATVQGTPSSGSLRYAMLDENPMTSTDYNELGTAGYEDRLDMTTLGGSPTTILCVAPVAYATGDGTITQVRTLVESNGSTTYGTNQTVPTGGTYGIVTDFYTTDPSGGAAFTKARIDAMLCGYEAN